MDNEESLTIGQPSGRNAGRTVHGVPLHARKQAADPHLVITGLVERERALTPYDLARLPRVPYLDGPAYQGLDNYPDTNWIGVLVSDLVALALPSTEARYLSVQAGPYSYTFQLADANRAMICDSIGADPITAEQGGPWRLIAPGTRYNMGVKWVERIVLTAGPMESSAIKLAEKRQQARDFHARGSGD